MLILVILYKYTVHGNSKKSFANLNVGGIQLLTNLLENI